MKNRATRRRKDCPEHGPQVAFSPTERADISERLRAAWERNVERDRRPDGFDVTGFDKRYRRFDRGIEIEQGMLDCVTNKFDPYPRNKITRWQHDASLLRTVISALVEALENIAPTEAGVSALEETIAWLQAQEVGLRTGAHNRAEWLLRIGQPQQNS